MRPEDMDEKFIGCVISAETDSGDAYQGKLTTVDPNSHSITMANVLRNGLPLNRCCTLTNSEILSLRVIRGPGVTVPVKRPSPTIYHSQPISQAQKSGTQRPLKKPVSSSEAPTSPTLTTSSSVSSSQVPPTSSSESSVSNKPKNVLPPKSKGKSSSAGKQKFSALAVEKLFEAHSKSPQKTASKSSSSRSKSRQTPEKVPFTHDTEDISATPLFKNFEPQVRQPKVLSKLLSSNGSSKSGCSKKQGPSGNPVLDALNHYQGIGRRFNKNNLSEPIDFDLDSDFDFAENLKLFEKDEEDDDYYENVEKLKISHNFAHYENIVEDENRVTSWTNLHARNKQNAQKNEKKSIFHMNALSFEKTMDGHPIPAISAQEKKEFLTECKSSLGEHVLDTVIADRVFQWVSEVQICHGDAHGTIIVLASAANSVRSVRRLLAHFDNRRYNCHLFGKFPGEHFDHVNVVEDVKLLPKKVPIICILSQEINEDVQSWLRLQESHQPHFVCVESVPSVVDPSRCHLLQFGCATNGLRHVERKVPLVCGGITFERLCQGITETTSTVVVDSAIADLGTPTSWFDDLSAKFIATAFATTFLVRLSHSK